MATIPQLAVVRINWFGRCFGQRIMLTTGYIKTAGPSTLTVEQECNQLIDDLLVGGGVDLLTTYMACLPDAYSMEKVTCQVVSPLRYSAIQRTVVTPGTNVNPATVANDSACITLAGELAGARNRSNKHIGPIPDGASASGLLTVGYVALLTALKNKLLAHLTFESGVHYEPCVINTPPLVGVGMLDRGTVGAQSRVQRRRTVGLGE